MEDLLRGNLSESAVVNIQSWLNEPKYAEYKEELEGLIRDEKWQDLEDAFFKVLEFGTGGRRGTTGIGSNRINKVTIGESAQALCLYAETQDEKAPEKGVVIAHDTRNTSVELAQYAAQVCAANGFKTYIFDGYRATPELSFAVRHLGCAVGIVISASHNPPTDNGFKACWSDGGQLLNPHDKGVLAVAAEIDEINSLPSFDEAVEQGKIEVIGEAVDEAYYKAVLEQAEGSDRQLSIVYSPLHGAGQRNVLPVLERAGFEDIRVVEEQMTPDGNFPTIPSGKPNPEEREANLMAVELMMKSGADIAITNDPDADRIGCIVNHHGEAVYLNGNQAASLITDYSLRRLKEKGELTPDHFVVKTIVTTDMMNALAKKYGVNIYDNLLIGFKYISQVMEQKEGTKEVFVFGGEESFGALKGNYARDKDGATGALPLAEFAAELKKDGKTLVDRMWELYEELGLYVEKLSTSTYPGAEGFSTMQRIMQSLRQDPPVEIGGHKVSATLDYKTLKKTSSDGSVEDIDCVSGDVLVFELGSRQRRVTIRPSGTEPKLKFYMQWHTESEDPKAEFDQLDADLDALLGSLSEEALRRV